MLFNSSQKITEHRSLDQCQRQAGIHPPCMWSGFLARLVKIGHWIRFWCLFQYNHTLAAHDDTTNHTNQVNYDAKIRYRTLRDDEIYAAANLITDLTLDFLSIRYANRIANEPIYKLLCTNHSLGDL